MEEKAAAFSFLLKIYRIKEFMQLMELSEIQNDLDNLKKRLDRFRGSL